MSFQPVIAKTALLLSLSLVFNLVSDSPAAEPQRETISQTCGIQLKEHNFNSANLKLLHNVGFRVIRKGFHWRNVEREKGAYDFKDYDAAMNEAKRLGLKVVGCLFGGNELYENDSEGGIQTEAGRKGFATFAAALAKHFKDHDVVWEVWNEPNVRTFWRKSGKHNSDEFADEYTALVNAVVPAMLKADSDCMVLAGSVSNYWEPSYQWTESCFRKGILKSGIRGWSVHPYGVKTPEEFSIGHDRMRQLLKKYGAADMPLFNTERGFAVKPTQEGWSGGEVKQAREYQAWHLVRQFLIDRMNNVNLSIWYEWDGNEFGISDENGARPAFATCREMFKQLRHFRFVRRIETESETDYLLLFADGYSQTKLVAWTAPPAGSSPDEAKQHAVTVEIVTKLKSANVAGESQTINAVTGTIPLMLSGAPQYVALPEGIRLGREAQRSVSPFPTESRPAVTPQDGLDLSLFSGDTRWTFVKNTGEGSFSLGEDGDKSIGVMNFDFTKSTSKSTPYVLATAPVDIPAAREINIHARSAIPQKLTFRIVDSTGQTHQFKSKTTAPNEWKAIRISLTKRMEHWGGAKDGKIHFPVKEIVFSVPLPNDETKSGKVEYSAVSISGASSSAVVSTNVSNTPSRPPAKRLTGILALDVFKRDTIWKFMKNTGEGSFELIENDGKAFGTMQYDFSRSKSKSTPYVLASVYTDIPTGARQLQLSVRSSVKQQLTFRVVDTTGQNHQFKTRISGSGKWESIQIPLTKRLEHWGGANDGTIHFPIKQLVFGVPLPNKDTQTGSVDYSDVVAVGDP